MPKASGFQVRLFTSDKSKWRVLSGNKDNAGAVLSADWSITRTEGYADATLTLTGSAKDCPGMVNGRRVELWGADRDGNRIRLYRGEVVRVYGEEAQRGRAAQTKVVLLGLWLKVAKLIVRQRYAWTDQPDLSVAFTTLSSSWVAKKYPDVRIESAPTGQTIDSLDAWRRPYGDVVNDLLSATGGFAVAGCDVADFTTGGVTTSLDRVFLRPYDAPGTVKHWLPLPDPSRSVSNYDKDTDASHIVNVVDVVGGPDRFPNLLAQAVAGNTSFEQPTFNAATTGNLLSDASFENHDSSDVYGGASYKSGGLTEGPTDSGDYMVELDTVGEGVTKTATSGIVSGHQYTFTPRLRLIAGGSIGSRARLRLRFYSGSTLLQTVPLEFDNTNGLDSATWGSFEVRGICPTGATKIVCDVDLTAKVGDGVLVDNASLYDSSMVRQAGWEAKATGSASVDDINWRFEGVPAYHGAYSVYAKVAASNVDFQDVAFQPVNDAKYTVSGNQKVRLFVWCHLAPGATSYPLCMLFVNDSTGSSDRRYFTPFSDTPDATVSDGAGGQWQLFTLEQTVDPSAESAGYNFTARGSGELVFDGCGVRDAAVTIAQIAAEFLEAEQIGAVVRADATAVSDPVHSSINDWGEQWSLEEQASLTTPGDVQKYGTAKLKASALPIEKPPLEVVGRAVDFWPGQYIGAFGRDAADVLPVPLPIAEVEGSWSDGLIRLRPVLVTERESETRVTRQIARDAARKAGGGSSSSSSYAGGSSGGSGGGGSGGTTTPLAIQDEGAAVTSRPTLNFIGAGVTVADDPVNSRTNVTIPGASGGTGDMAKSTYDPNNDGIIALAQGGTGASDAGTARTNLGLGSAATASTGTASGNVPVLDSGGKIPTGILPALAISSTFVVNTQAAMLALSAQEGDVAVRTDLSKSYILTGAGPATTLANWQELLTPTDAVQSVNGHTGTVTGLLETANNLSEFAGSAATARGNLGLGSSATHPSSDYEPALGNPASNGRILSSTTSGTRSWINAPTTPGSATETTAGIVTLSQDGGRDAGEVVQATDSRLLPRIRQGFFGGSTPSVTGADTFEFVVPFSLSGATIIYDLRSIVWRVAGSGVSAATVELELHRGTGAFSAVSGWGPQVTMAASTFETFYNVTPTGPGAYPVARSGEKLRMRITTALTGAPSGWAIFVTLIQNTSGVIRAEDQLPGGPNP